MGVKFNSRVIQTFDSYYRYNCWRCEKKITQNEIGHHLLLCNPTYEKQINLLKIKLEKIGNVNTNEKVYYQCQLRSYITDYKVADTVLYILRYKDTYNKSFFELQYFKKYIIAIYCYISDIRSGKVRPTSTVTYIMKWVESIKESLIYINIPIIDEIKNEILAQHLFLIPFILEPYDMEMYYSASNTNPLQIKNEEVEIDVYLNWPMKAYNKRNIAYTPTF